MGNNYEDRFILKEPFKTIESIREESKKIFYSSDNLLNEENLKKFIKAINLDNTNEEIIISYDNFLMKKKSKTYEKDIKEYLLFFKEVKDGKKEIFNFFDILINFKNNLDDKINFFQFLIREMKFFDEIKYKNNLPINKKNYNNIYYCKLYENLIKFLFKKYENEKINSLKTLINQNKKRIEDFKKKMNLETSKKYLPVTIKELDKIFCCNFFEIYIKLLSDFIKKIKNFIEFLKELSLDEFLKDINKNILLENLIFYIQKRNFLKNDNPIITNEYFLFNDSALDIGTQIEMYKDENIKITRPNDNTLSNIVLITFNNEAPIQFNYNIYSLGYACNEIKNQNNIYGHFNKVIFSKFDSNNIFRNNWENLKNDIKDIFSSECMKNFLNKNNLFDLFNYENQQLLDEILDNVIFYPFISENSYACFTEDFQTIYLQGIPKKEIDSAEYFIVLYAFQIICLIYELFNFYFCYLRFINQEKKRFNFQSPKNCCSHAKERKGESGEWIEENLFGRHIQNLSVKESLFIFSMKDYKGGFENFKKEFKKCQNLKKNEFKIEYYQKYIQKFNDTIASFGIEEDKLDIDKCYTFSNKKTDNLGVGEDIFFYNPSLFIQTEFQNMEDILSKEYILKIKNMKID